MRGAGPWPTARTRVVALLGWPTGHSLSPAIHNAAFREVGADLVYVALPTPPADLLTVVRSLGSVGAAGANVTVPHKEAVVAACDALTPEAELVGAVNTLAWSTEGLVGHNTDASGLGRVLAEEVGIAHGDGAVVLGTGGAARAVVVALARLGCGVTVVGRRAEAAEELARLAETAGAPASDALDLADEGWCRRAVADARLVCNATPLGMEREPLPAPFMTLGPGQIAYDLVYRPADTPFLVAAAGAGAAAHHGLGMLVAQAADAFEVWTGQAAPTGVMSAVAIAGLRGHD
ncbi:MAG: shikimate dehydrogenase [Actinomycetes bacterium]